MPPYLVFLVVFFALPLAALLAIRRDVLRYKRTLLWSLLFTFTIGGFWDWLSVRTNVWRYDSAETLGMWLWGLPIEELIGFYLFGGLFIACVALTVLRRN